MGKPGEVSVKDFDVKRWVRQGRRKWSAFLETYSHAKGFDVLRALDQKALEVGKTARTWWQQQSQSWSLTLGLAPPFLRERSSEDSTEAEDALLGFGLMGGGAATLGYGLSKAAPTFGRVAQIVSSWFGMGLEEGFDSNTDYGIVGKIASEEEIRTIDTSKKGSGPAILIIDVKTYTLPQTNFLIGSIAPPEMQKQRGSFREHKNLKGSYDNHLWANKQDLKQKSGQFFREALNLQKLQGNGTEAFIFLYGRLGNYRPGNFPWGLKLASAGSLYTRISSEIIEPGPSFGNIPLYPGDVGDAAQEVFHDYFSD